jgi:putative sigma-54 modulation protein
MRVVLSGRNVDVTPALRTLIERKLGKLERTLNDSAVSAQVVLALQRHRHLTEITVHARGDHMLHGVGDGTSWPLSCSLAIEKIGQQAHKLKDRWETRRRRGRRIPPPAVVERPARDERRIIRTRRDAVKPMSVEDAALRVDAGRDEFIVFRNAATDTINILYRRRDGHFGLIDPEP